MTQVDPNFAMVVIVGVGNIVTWIMMFRSNHNRQIKDAAERGAQESAEQSGIRDLASANQRIANALENLDKWARNHELADTRWQSSAEQIMKQQSQTNADISLMLQGVQRQIANLALGLAPSEAQQIPPNRRR